MGEEMVWIHTLLPASKARIKQKAWGGQLQAIKNELHLVRDELKHSTQVGLHKKEQVMRRLHTKLKNNMKNKHESTTTTLKTEFEERIEKFENKVDTQSQNHQTNINETRSTVLETMNDIATETNTNIENTEKTLLTNLSTNVTQSKNKIIENINIASQNSDMFRERLHSRLTTDSKYMQNYISNQNTNMKNSLTLQNESIQAMMEELSEQNNKIGTQLENMIYTENEKMGGEYQQGLRIIGNLLTTMGEKLTNLNNESQREKMRKF